MPEHLHPPTDKIGNRLRDANAADQDTPLGMSHNRSDSVKGRARDEVRGQLRASSSAVPPRVDR